MKPTIFFGRIIVCFTILCQTFGDYSSYQQFVKTNLTHDPKYQDDLRNHFDKFNSHNQDLALDFSCEFDVKDCSIKPDSVHALRPCHVDVVAALGDSITAGNGAKASNIVEVLIEYRGVSWSVGGDGPASNIHTLPNIIRRFNPNVKGFSLLAGPITSEDSHLNVAIPGAHSNNLLKQAKMLSCRLHSELGVKFLTDWKVITIFVGANNLCQFCKDPVSNSPERYVSDILNTLDYLHANVPRVLVNLVQTVNISFIHAINRGPICNLVHMMECSCAEKMTLLPELSKMVEQYHRGLEKMVAGGRYETRDDFTVVIQPFLVKSSPPLLAGSTEPDLSYFAPDCFHFSQKGHGTAAHALWNNMLQSVGQKQEVWQTNGEIACPRSGQFFATSKNSNKALSRQSSGQEENSSSTTIIIIICVVCILLLAAVITVIVVRYQKRGSGTEKLYLLENGRT